MAGFIFKTLSCYMYNKPITFLAAICIWAWISISQNVTESVTSKDNSIHDIRYTPSHPLWYTPCLCKTIKVKVISNMYTLFNYQHLVEFVVDNRQSFTKLDHSLTTRARLEGAEWRNVYI